MLQSRQLSGRTKRLERGPGTFKKRCGHAVKPQQSYTPDVTTEGSEQNARTTEIESPDNLLYSCVTPPTFIHIS